MKSTSILTFALLFLISCQPGNSENSGDETEKDEAVTEEVQNSTSGPKLYILTTTAVGTDENQVKTDSLSEITSEYFEVGLYLLSDGNKGYVATKKIEEPTSLENFRYVFFNVTDENGETQYFKSSTEFLNYMAERDYVMQAQEKDKYHTDYVFKKR